MTTDHNQDVSCASISVPGGGTLTPEIHAAAQVQVIQPPPMSSQLKCKIQTDGRLIFLAELPRLPTFQLIAIPIKIHAPV